VVASIAAAADDLLDFSTAVFGIWSPTHGVFAEATSASVPSEWSVMRSRRD
jgi:hypothetical protein